jgi:hypothetical protein
MSTPSEEMDLSNEVSDDEKCEVVGEEDGGAGSGFVEQI